jgi:hypothetical protein
VVLAYNILQHQHCANPILELTMIDNVGRYFIIVLLMRSFHPADGAP